MHAKISRRRCGLLLGNLALAALAGGCSSMFGRKPETSAGNDAATAVQTTSGPIHIIYRTRTDRLNLAGATLPHCAIAELRIDFPHHDYKTAVCSAIVKTTPCSVSATPFPERGVTSTVAAMFADTASTGPVPTSAAWSSDVALWEGQAIVASLEAMHFFRKQRTVLSAEVYLSVETDKYAVGKKYRPVVELDALIVRISQEHAAQPPANMLLPQSVGLARLPKFD